MFNQGLDWLEQRLMGFCSSPVQYWRNSDTWTIDAVFGKTDIQIQDHTGISVSSFVWDFLIDAQTLGFEPAVGDLIIILGRQFEVMSLSGQGCWRWTGPNRRTYRIHTKDIGDDVHQ